jgi:hypothetical protein
MHDTHAYTQSARHYAHTHTYLRATQARVKSVPVDHLHTRVRVVYVCSSFVERQVEQRRERRQHVHEARNVGVTCVHVEQGAHGCEVGQVCGSWDRGLLSRGGSSRVQLGLRQQGVAKHALDTVRQARGHRMRVGPGDLHALRLVHVRSRELNYHHHVIGVEVKARRTSDDGRGVAQLAELTHSDALPVHNHVARHNRIVQANHVGAGGREIGLSASCIHDGADFHFHRHRGVGAACVGARGVRELVRCGVLGGARVVFVHTHTSVVGA